MLVIFHNNIIYIFILFIFSILSDIKNEVILPIEKENLESSEILLEDNDINKKIFTEEDNKIDNCNNDGYIVKKRSKTFEPNISYKNAPKPHLKISNEYISPLKLNIRSFGNFSNLNKRPNQILFDFQKNLFVFFIIPLFLFSKLFFLLTLSLLVLILLFLKVLIGLFEEDSLITVPFDTI